MTGESTSWFAERGPFLKHRQAKTLMVAGSVGLLAYQLLPQTVFKDYFQDLTSLKRDGCKVELGNQLSEILQRALTDLRFTDTEKSLVEGYIMDSYQIQHFGSVNSMFGASIGIPEYFQCATAEEARLDYLELPHVKNQRKAEELLRVKETLILSEKAKLYAIAREAVQCKDWKFFFEAGYAPLCFLQTIKFSLWLDKKYLLETARVFRCPAFVVVALLGTAVYSLFSDVCSFMFDEIAESEVCNLGRSYMEGGVEYCEKMMLCQSQMRNLLGGLGKQLFLENGDHNFTRTRKLPLSERLAVIKFKMEEKP